MSRTKGSGWGGGPILYQRCPLCEKKKAMYTNRAETVRQSALVLPCPRQRGKTIIPRTSAPAITLMEAKLAASMVSWPSAKRHRIELAANAIIAMPVVRRVLVSMQPVI